MKYCPLSFVWVDYGKDDRGHSYHSCLQKECAWWIQGVYEQNGICAVPALVTNCDGLRQSVDLVVNEFQIRR